MSDTPEVTVSSQLKSADTASDIANHSGKENRGKYQHKNEDIDPSMSHKNVEFNPYDKRELLWDHYGEKIEKHNKNNNSASRQWDLDTFLNTFEGKEVKINGKETGNKRWATASQVSYFGSNELLNPVLDEIEDAGASQDEILEAYAMGYEEYIQRHNEYFTTLPIYHSDVHFDETTPHGHDAIVVKGHTQKGTPSDSLNNALGEMYGYAKGFDGKQANLEAYRAENDMLMFDSVGRSLEGLAQEYGLDIEFQELRTGQEGSYTSAEYKAHKELEEREGDVEERERDVEVRTKAQKKQTQKHKERKRELDDREKNLDNREAELDQKSADLNAKEHDLRDEQRKLEEREKRDRKKEQSVKNGFLAIASYGENEVSKVFADRVRNKGVAAISQNEFEGTIMKGVEGMENQAKRSRSLHAVNDYAKYREKSQEQPRAAEREKEDDGPELG